MKSPLTMRRFVQYGAFVDLAAFCASFVFFGGAHGPEGPMFMLTVINAPMRSVARALVPADSSSENIDLVMMFAVVLLNGALYGLIIGIGVAFWRAVFRRDPAA